MVRTSWRIISSRFLDGRQAAATTIAREIIFRADLGVERHPAPTSSARTGMLRSVRCLVERCRVKPCQEVSTACRQIFLVRVCRAGTTSVPGARACQGITTQTRSGPSSVGLPRRRGEGGHHIGASRLRFGSSGTPDLKVGPTRRCRTRALPPPAARAAAPAASNRRSDRDIPSRAPTRQAARPCRRRTSARRGAAGSRSRRRR